MIASTIHSKKLLQFIALFVFMTIAPFAVIAQAGDPDIPDFAKHKIDKQAFMEKRAEAINMMRGVRNGVTIDPQIRKMAIEQMQSQERALRGSGNNFVGSPWVPVGPAPIPNGQTQGGVSTPVSGRTTAIAVHPTNSNIVYAGVAQGGVYRTTNGGASWTPIFDAAESLAIGAITISPSNPEIVYVGTGEPNFSSDSYFGVGVYRITNASTTATLSGPLNKDALNADIFSGRGIGNIIVHPTNPAIIFVSSTSGVGGIRSANSTFPSRGIYRCDNATSGSPVFNKLTGLIGNLNVSVRDIAIDPLDPNILIASPIATGTNQGGIYRSTNALSAIPTSVTFTQVLVTNSTSTSTLNAEFAAIHPSGDVDATFYAATGVSNGRVLKSTDGGATWVTTVTNGFCGGQCFYDIAIAVDPSNVNTVYLGGDPTLVAAKSVNGGTSFVESKVGLHVDTHVLTVDPSTTTTVWLGTDGGIYKSTNSGTTWTHQNTAEFSATQFMSIDAHPIDPNYSIGGTQDNGTNMYKPDGSWNRIDFGDGGYAVIDQNAVDNINVRMYHTYFNASNLQGYGTVSTTATASDGLWAFRGCQTSGGTTNGITCTGTINFYAPLERGPGNPNTIYYGSDRLYRSADNGTTHTVVSQNPIVSGVALSSIGISPQNDNVRIVGLNNGVIFGTTTGSATLVDMDPNNDIPNLAIARTIIDPNNVNTAYVTLSGFNQPSVWKTTNLNAGAGIVWTNVSGTIPQIPANSIVIDPANSNNVFVGTDIGVYGSTNGGTSWVPYGTSLPRVAVFDMAITAGGKLRIATHGRGMWENQIICPAITVTNPATSTGTTGTAFSQTFTQTGGAAPVTFSTTSTLPTGLTLSAAGVLSGTPTQTGTFPIVVTLTDNNGCTGTSGTYSLVISSGVCPATVNQPANQTLCNAASTTAVTFTGSAGSTFAWTNNTTSIGLAASGTGNIASFAATNAGGTPVVATITVTPTSGGASIPELLYYKFDGAGASVPNLASAPPAGAATATLEGALTQGGSAICNGTLIGTGGSGNTDFLNTGWITNFTGTSWSISLKVDNQSASTDISYLFGDPTAGNFRCFTNGVAGAGNIMLRGTVNDVTINGGAVAGVHTSTFVYDAVAGNIYGYLDGVLVTTVAQVAVTITGTGPFKVSGHSVNAGLLAGSLLDEFRVYNRALSLSEVQALTACSVTCNGAPKTFTYTVNPTPVVSNPATTTGTSGVAFSQTFTQTGGAAPVTFSTTSTLPTGLTLSAAGVLSGTPTQTGTFPILVKATDANTCMGTGATYNLVISAAPCPAITVTNPATTTGTSGVAFSQTFTQTGGAAPVTFSTTSTLPTGLTLSAAGVLSGTPTQTGTFPIVVEATDANTCMGTGATYNLVISAAPCPAITVTNPATTTGTSGVAFSQTFTATGGLAPYTYATTSTLPAGLTLAANGTLSGTPTASGNFPIIVTATDANTCAGTGGTYTLVISGACPVITVTNPTITVGTVSSAFSQSFTASGGASPYTFTTFSTLPAGLTLAANGTLSGTPTVAGSYPISLKVTDANSCVGTGGTYTLVINPCGAGAAGVIPGTFVNGTLSTGTIANDGITAPAGTNWSEVQNNTGNLTESNVLSGSTCAIGLFTLADDFTIPAGQTWDISRLSFYAYQTGGPVATPFTALYLQIHDANPSLGPTTILFGDLTTNRLSSSVDANLYRLFNSTVPPPGSSPGTARKIWRNEANVTLSLGAGTYWLEWASEIASNPTASHFAPANTIFGLRGEAGYNALQKTVSTGNWADVIDTGNPGTASDFPLDFPIEVNYTTICCPTPTVNQPTNQTVCAGQNTTAVTFTGTVPGTTYNWTNDNTATGLAASGTGDIAAFMATNATAAAITSTITVTPTFTNGTVTCTGAAKTFTITVNPQPTVNQPTNQVVCNNAATMPVTFTGSAGSVFNWTNSDPSIGLAAFGMGNIAAFTATNTGNAPVVATVIVTPNLLSGGGPVTTTYSNAGNVNIPGTGTSGIADPYPSAITVAGAGGTITKVVVKLNGIAHTFPDDIDMLLVGPGGQDAIILSDVGGGTDIIGVNLVLDDDAASDMPNSTELLSGTYKPTNIGAGDPFDAPAPTPSGNVALSTFIGTAANGVWNLYIDDDAGGDAGLMANGWELVITTTGGSTTCPGVPKTFTYTVNPTPAVNSVPNKTECNNTTTAPIAFTSPTTGGTVTYNWTNSNTAIGLAASGSGNIPAYLATNAGTTPITATISVTPSYSNAGVTCVGVASTFTITVNPTPNVNQPANQTVCVGEMTAPITFAGTVPGTTFEWMNSNTATGLAASGTGNIAAFTTTNTTNAPLVSTVTVTPYFGAAGGGLQPELLHYKFNGSGTTVPNLALTPPAGTANATINGGQTQGGSGICDGTLIGTGANSGTDFVNTNWATNLTGTSWTISVKLANITAGTFAYMFGDNTAGSFRCFANGAAGSGNLMLRGNINDVIITGGAQTSAHTSTFVYDAVAGNIKGYLDGTLVTTVAQTPVAIAGTDPFKVGGYATSGGLPAGALLDEFRLYNRALSAADVQALTACVSSNSACAGPTKTFTITVNPVLSITCPANQTLTSAVGSCSAVATYAPVVTGAPTPVITYSFSGATTGSGAGSGSGRSFNVGVTTVTLTATNVCGTKTCTFTITVNDGQLPVITTQPTTRSACESGNTTLSVTATNAVSYQWEFYNGTAWVSVAGATASTYTVNNLVRNSNTNTYRVKVIGLCTTLTSTTATIFVLAKPEVSIVSNQTLLIPGSRFVLMAVTDRPAGTGSYVWFKNSAVIPGVSGGTLPAGNIDDRGTYKVTFTDANGCVNTSADFVIGSIPTTEIFVYPNPSNGQFQIRYNNLSNEEATIFIYNARGQVIYQRKMPTGTQTYGRLDVNISNMAAGTYIIKLINGAGRVLGSKRIIKSN